MYKVWTVEDIKKVLNEVSKKMGLDCSCVDIKVSNRMKTCKGRYDYFYRKISGKTYDIIPKQFIFASRLLSGDYSEEAVRHTIIHEYIHFYTNHMDKYPSGHNNSFKRNCRLAGISESTYFEFDVPVEDKIVKQNKNYKVTCSDCGYTFKRVRFKGGVESFKSAYRCGNCHGDFLVEVI